MESNMKRSDIPTEVKYHHGNPRPMPEEVKDYFSIDADKGLLLRKKHINNKWCKGSQVGGIGAQGYLVTSFKGNAFRVHRIIYFIHHNKQPNIVDHINGDVADNRVCNLRSCTSAQNNYNSKVSGKNKYGCNGIVYRHNRKKYRVNIDVKGKRIYLGLFKSLESAVNARLMAETKYHGEYAYNDA